VLASILTLVLTAQDSATAKIAILPDQGRPPEPDVRLWYEISVNASFEFLAGSQISGNVFYSDVYYDTTAIDVQAATVIAWVPRWGWFHDAMIRPHVGWSYREFVGQTFTDDAGVSIHPDPLGIQTTYLGLTIGSGHLPEDHDFGFMGYLTVQLGASFIRGTEVRSSLFAGEQRLIKDTTAFYVSVGIGAEFMLEWVSFRIEAGFRSFGTPRDGGSRIDVSSDDIAAAYLLLGVTFAF
jgi:hypothetical protein